MSGKKHIKALPIQDYSGFSPKPGCIPFAKKHQYFIVTDISIAGDAPKDFICYYQYGVGRKSNPNTWPRYIAKHGHKHYPMEAITEYLLNRIGEIFGFKMAKSKLAWLGGQIRFLSEYFLKNSDEQVLYHGADLYAGYLNDRSFVEQIEEQNQSAEFFTIQLTLESLKHFFPDYYGSLMSDFVLMLIFDALIGNNDRHYYNWGIIRNIKGNAEPIFAPIYDTARGLFWNEDEDKLLKVYTDKNRINKFIEKYCENSTPKIGWDGSEKLNHFQLVERIKTESLYLDYQKLENLCNPSMLNNVLLVIDTEFHRLISKQRRELIKMCLLYRHKRIRNLFNFAI